MYVCHKKEMLKLSTDAWKALLSTAAEYLYLVTSHHTGLASNQISPFRWVWQDAHNLIAPRFPCEASIQNEKKAHWDAQLSVFVALNYPLFTQQSPIRGKEPLSQLLTFTRRKSQQHSPLYSLHSCVPAYSCRQKCSSCNQVAHSR